MPHVHLIILLALFLWQCGGTFALCQVAVFPAILAGAGLVVGAVLILLLIVGLIVSRIT